MADLRRGGRGCGRGPHGTPQCVIGDKGRRSLAGSHPARDGAQKARRLRSTPTPAWDRHARDGARGEQVTGPGRTRPWPSHPSTTAASPARSKPPSTGLWTNGGPDRSAWSPTAERPATCAPSSTSGGSSSSSWPSPSATRSSSPAAGQAPRPRPADRHRGLPRGRRQPDRSAGLVGAPCLTPTPNASVRDDRSLGPDTMEEPFIKPAEDTATAGSRPDAPPGGTGGHRRALLVSGGISIARARMAPFCS